MNEIAGLLMLHHFGSLFFNDCNDRLNVHSILAGLLCSRGFERRYYSINLGRRELSCPKLIQQIQEVRGNVIFGDTASGNPKQMRFGELDFPIGRSDSQQVSAVSSTPGPSNGNPHSIVDQLIDVALEV